MSRINPKDQAIDKAIALLKNVCGACDIADAVDPACCRGCGLGKALRALQGALVKTFSKTKIAAARGVKVATLELVK